MGLYYLPLLVGGQPVVFGKVRGILSQEERRELANCIESAQQKPVPVILFHAEKESKDTVCRLPNGATIFIMGQQGAAFRRMRETLPTFQKCLRNKEEM